MAFEKINENLHRLNESIRSFSESSAEYYKLDLFKKSMKGATSLVNLLVMGFFLLLSLFFLSLAVAFMLSEALGIPSSGFFIVGGFYVLLFLLVRFALKKKIEEFLLVKFSRMVFNELPDEDEKLTLDKDFEDETV